LRTHMRRVLAVLSGSAVLLCLTCPNVRAAGYYHYTNRANKYSITYPSTWQRLDDGTIVSAGVPLTGFVLRSSKDFVVANMAVEHIPTSLKTQYGILNNWLAQHLVDPPTARLQTLRLHNVTVSRVTALGGKGAKTPGYIAAEIASVRGRTFFLDGVVFLRNPLTNAWNPNRVSATAKLLATLQSLNIAQ
jgi:hypothetical protein